MASGSLASLLEQIEYTQRLVVERRSRESRVKDKRRESPIVNNISIGSHITAKFREWRRTFVLMVPPHLVACSSRRPDTRRARTGGRRRGVPRRGEGGKEPELGASSWQLEDEIPSADATSSSATWPRAAPALSAAVAEPSSPIRRLPGLRGAHLTPHKTRRFETEAGATRRRREPRGDVRMARLPQCALRTRFASRAVSIHLNGPSTAEEIEKQGKALCPACLPQSSVSNKKKSLWTFY